MPEITRIQTPLPSVQKRKRVAAYARVSLDCEQLLHSLSAQVSHYSSLIQSNPEWEYAGVYIDEGITGTSKDNRDGFIRLITDCEAGKIDIILVKSISRFARDTVDLLDTVRHLKDIGVEVRFERESISTLTGDGEVLLTLLASFAQQESESISQNAKWAIKKKFEQGIANTSLRCFGYDWDSENNTCVINKEEAVWVRYIYDQYLRGASIKGIATDLSQKGIKAIRGNCLNRSTIRRILTSEIYVGDVILQKYYSPKIRKPAVNNGQAPKYVVSDAHEGIVSRDEFEAVQERLLMRAKSALNAGYKRTLFAGLVKCGKCGYACNHVKHSCEKREYHHIECNRRKSKKCDLLPIEEQELKKIMQSILGKRDVLEKIVLFDDHIDFLIKGGDIKTHMRSYPNNSHNKTCFSRKVICGNCSNYFVRMNCGGKKVWSCKAKKLDRKACTVEYVTESELILAASSVLGTAENLEMNFYCKVDKAVVHSRKIDFYLKEGVVRTWERQ